MFHIVLYQPEIPPNTGNIIRLAANTGCRLHLIKPLGFRLGDKALKRARLDYQELACLEQHASWEDCQAQLPGRRFFALTTHASQCYASQSFTAGDVFVFGPETRGLPQRLLDAFPRECLLRLPMRPGNRSINLANTVAVVVYEAWRQLGYFEGS
jgi:tRNA (cytidine/uridine-2'-O-)-methyltransferase